MVEQYPESIRLHKVVLEAHGTNQVKSLKPVLVKQTGDVRSNRTFPDLDARALRNTICQSIPTFPVFDYRKQFPPMCDLSVTWCVCSLCSSAVEKGLGGRGQAQAICSVSNPFAMHLFFCTCGLGSAAWLQGKIGVQG